MRKTLWLLLFFVLVSYGLAIYFYPSMPAMIASHWNSQGQVNGHLPRFWGLFGLPFLITGLWILFLVIPLIDPLKKNIKKFLAYYDLLVLVIILFLLYVYVLTIVWNLGITYNMNALIVPAFAVLFLIMGFIMRKSRRNWFVGIRTPWTLSSDYVWKKTHTLASILFMIAAFVSLISLFLPTYTFYIFVAAVVLAALIPAIYSYVLFARRR
ncbi:MAG: SdpI family protein [Candidatus Woesearchaeota archaeon]